MEKLKYAFLLSNNGIYVCEKGDTLNGISKKFNLPVSIIIADNKLKKEVEENEILYLRKGGTLYTVMPNDTLENIAEKFGVLPENILKTNEISYVYPYEKIIIENEIR